MKRLSVLLTIALVVVLSRGSVLSTGDAGTTNGYWQLTSTTLDKASESKDVTVNLSENYASYRRSDTGTGDVFAASASWTIPQETYAAGEAVTLTLNVEVEQYDWHGSEGNFHPGLNFMGMHISARFDAPGVPYGFAGNSSIALRTEEADNVAEVSATLGTIHNASDSITVSASFPAAYTDGYQICLYVSPSSCGNACFLYTWVAETTPVETTATTETENEEKTDRQIWLSGIVSDIDNRIMPRLKLEIDVFTDADAWSPGTSAATPDKRLSLYTDIEGKFFAEINIPDDQSRDIGLLVQTELTCILKDNNEAFTLANMKYPAAQEQMIAASYIRVPVASQEYKNRPIILLGRKFSFFYLCVDAFSFNSKTDEPDLFWSNVPDNYELASSSYLYNVLWDALLFGTVGFDAGEHLKDASVKIETHWTPDSAGSGSKTSHYQIGTATEGTIRLLGSHSGYDDIARFTILHEFGHHFDSITNNGEFRAISLDTSGNLVNHGGYMNPSTADSFEEGLATAYAIFVQHYRKDKNPHIAGHFNLQKPGNYIAWKDNGKYEELAIAALLYDVYQGYSDKTAFWKLLQPNYATFYKYYQAIEADLKAATSNPQAGNPRLEQLRKAAIAGGLYKMPFGDGRYNRGEPFLDKKVAGSDYGDGNRSDDEIFADLMFAAGSDNWIREDNPLRTPPADLTPGKSSDALRDRETIDLIPNSYLYFENLTQDIAPDLTRLIVEIKSRGEDDSKQLLTMENNKIYLGLTRQTQHGKVVVSIPGGKTLYEGDIEALQLVREANTGLDVPLATVDLSKFNPNVLTKPRQVVFSLNDRYYERWPRPCYGSVKADELIDLPTANLISRGNEQALFKANVVQSHITPEYLADIEQGRIKPHPLRLVGRIVLIYAILLLVTACIVIVILVRNKKSLRRDV